jgi:hypothetical protein
MQALALFSTPTTGSWFFFTAQMFSMKNMTNGGTPFF